MKKGQDNQREAILLSYLAGIIDGEGCIRLQTIKSNSDWNTQYHAAISIGMTNKKVVQMLADRYGSNIQIECVPNRKPVYRWKKAGNKVVPPIIRELLPYLIVKRKHAELILKYVEGRNTSGFQRNKGLPKKELLWRKEIYRQMKELNAIGAPAETK